MSGLTLKDLGCILARVGYHVEQDGRGKWAVHHGGGTLPWRYRSRSAALRDLENELDYTLPNRGPRWHLRTMPQDGGLVDMPRARGA